jgi:hypothetical protein
MEKKWEEASITINGVALSVGQSMTVRVAIESFAMDLQMDLQRTAPDDEGYGPIGRLYQQRIDEIRDLILGQRPEDLQRRRID